MSTSTLLRWLVVAVSAAMLLVVAAACGTETVEVPGETVVVEKVVTETVEVPGETVVVEKEVVRTVEVPGETVTREVVKEVMVPGETVVVEKEVVRTVEVPGQTVVVEKEVVKEIESERYVRNVWGELVDRPQYGGSIVIGIPDEFPSTDPSGECWGGCRMTGGTTFEKMGAVDWAVPRDEFDFTAGYVNLDFVTGALAESWEQPDVLTTIFHIRKGIHWQDKAPLNGRELTAKDVEYSWHRIMGLGSGYSEPDPDIWVNIPVVSVTAADDWTVEVKASEFSFDTLQNLLISTQMFHSIHATPEIIEQHGDTSDWENLVGTGAYLLTDYKDGDSMTFTKNPNYWGYDPLHPDNRLPYADEFKVIVLPEEATQVAALRSGKIAFVNRWQSLGVDQIEGLQRTNPELTTKKYTGWGANVAFNTEGKPFDNINVRIAMQKAINLEEMVRLYYRGNADATPWGIAPAVSGMSAPYEEWPEDVKWMYEYDPEAAEKLLDDAGLPRGSDGIRFSREWNTCYYPDTDAALYAATYWQAIGVEIKLDVPPDDSLCWEMMSTRDAEGNIQFEMISSDTRHALHNPLSSLRGHYHTTKGHIGEGGSIWGVNDPTFDALVDKAEAITDLEELKKLGKELDMYVISQMWSLYVPPVVDGRLVVQPWLKGYRGENGVGDTWTNSVPYMWVDLEMQKDMGH